MKTIKILNNSIYTIKFIISYGKNSPLSSNYITSTNSGSLTLDDNAQNITILVQLIDTFKQLRNSISINLPKAIDKYYEFIGSTEGAQLLELNNYTNIINPKFISLINKSSTNTLKVSANLGMLLRYDINFGVREESNILKNNDYFSFPIPVNDFLSLEFIIYISSKSSPKPSDFKPLKFIYIKNNSNKFCFEFSRKNFTLGLYESKNCYTSSSYMLTF